MADRSQSESALVQFSERLTNSAAFGTLFREGMDLVEEYIGVTGKARVEYSEAQEIADGTKELARSFADDLLGGFEAHLEVDRRRGHAGAEPARERTGAQRGDLGVHSILGGEHEHGALRGPG